MLTKISQTVKQYIFTIRHKMWKGTRFLWVWLFRKQHFAVTWRHKLEIISQLECRAFKGTMIVGGPPKKALNEGLIPCQGCKQIPLVAQWQEMGAAICSCNWGKERAYLSFRRKMDGLILINWLHSWGSAQSNYRGAISAHLKVFVYVLAFHFWNMYLYFLYAFSIHT